MHTDPLINAVQSYLAAETYHCDREMDGPKRDESRRTLEKNREELHRQLEAYAAAAQARQPIFRRILVAVNDTAPARWAAELASRIAETSSAELALVHVVDPGRYTITEFGISDPNLREEHLRAGHELLDRTAAHLSPSVPATRMLREGDPAGEINALARQWGADLIVVGTHGRGRLAHLLFGSIAQSVIKLVPCPILTVTHQPTPAQKVRALLDSANVPYELIPHQPGYTAMESAHAACIPGRELAKTTIVKLDGRLAMVVLPATHKVDLALVRRATGANVAQIAPEAEFAGLFPDCQLGAMPPFGNLYGMKVYVADILAEDEMIAFNAGTHAELIRIPYRDFQRLANPLVAPLTEAIAYA